MLADLRTRLRTWLEEREIVASDVAPIVAACSEIVAAAIVGVASPVEVTAELGDSDVVVRCRAGAAWPIEDDPSRHVASLLVDHVSIERDERGATVVLRKTFHRGLQGPWRQL